MNYYYYKTIEKLSKKGSIPGLESIGRLLDELNHPERQLKMIHIAGTNGKGSIFAFLSSILQEGGYRVGRYISPTIECYEERFQINGVYIAKTRLEHYFSVIEAAMVRMEAKYGMGPTLFEAETAIAFLYFAEEQVDYALIETGMGGTLDATNIMERPLLTVISSISFDHKSILGNTLEEIAAQKAGILKRTVPVILSENPQNVRKVIDGRASELHCCCFPVKEEDYIIIEENEKGSHFIWKEMSFNIRLPGRYQVSNGVTALEAAKQLHLLWDPKNSLGKKAMTAGLEKTVWPGRLELLGEKPLFYRDGAHNPDAARKLAQFLEKHFTNRKIIYIMGVLKDKEYGRMLEYLLPPANIVYVFRPDNERGLAAEVLAGTIHEMGKNAVICSDVNDGIRKAMAEASEDDVVIACGSLSFMEDMEVTK